MVEEGLLGQGSGIRIKTPLTKEGVKNLKLGDMVLISGRIVTGRDRVHKYLFNERPKKDDIPFDLEGSILYHCGPIIKGSYELGVGSDELKDKGPDSPLKLIAGGPTTSIRVEMYEPLVIREYGIRGIIGKGGMGKKTLDAMRECGCVYLHSISGAAVYLADRVKRIIDGWKVEEFGMPEAMWLFEVEDFPAIVTMDAHGNSLHRENESVSGENLKRLLSQEMK